MAPGNRALYPATASSQETWLGQSLGARGPRPHPISFPHLGQGQVPQGRGEAADLPGPGPAVPAFSRSEILALASPMGKGRGLI